MLYISLRTKTVEYYNLLNNKGKLFKGRRASYSTLFYLSNNLIVFLAIMWLKMTKNYLFKADYIYFYDYYSQLVYRY